MKLYTKCMTCGKELEVTGGPHDFTVLESVFINNNALCVDCATKERKALIEKISKRYSLDTSKVSTFVKDGILYLSYPIARSDFVVDTKLEVPYIRVDDLYYSLAGMDEAAILSVIGLVRFLVRFMED